MQPAQQLAVRSAGLLAAACLVLPSTACGSDGAALANESDPSDISIVLDPVVELTDVDGKATAVALDAGYVQALRAGSLTFGVAGIATLAAGELVLPITGGDVTYYKPGTIDPYVRGHLLHAGSGLSLSDGRTTVELRDLTVDPDTAHVSGDLRVDGRQVAQDLNVFEVDGSTLEQLRNRAPDSVVLAGSKILVSATLARLVRNRFGTDAIKARLLVGVATITISR